MKRTNRMNWKIMVALLAMAGMMTGILAGSRAEATETNDVATNIERMKTLRQAVDDAEAVYLKSPRDQSDAPWAKFQALNDTNVPQIFALARLDPGSDESYEMFVWIIKDRRTRIHSLYTNAFQSLEFLRDYHTANTNVGAVCRILGRNWDPLCRPAREFLERVAKQNPDREARGQATLALASLDLDRVQGMEYFQTAPQGNALFESKRKEYLAEIQQESPAQVTARAQQLLQTVLAQYADCPSLQPSNSLQYKATLGDVTRTKLYELEHLSVGKRAPDFEGQDIAGKQVRLSDYHGRVVMISFWASWCGPCMQMVPAEVRLAERLKDKPFSLLGVNGDTMKENVRLAVQKERMTWPSVFSEKGSDGPVPSTWNINGWPTVFLLDTNGVIRFRFEGYGPSTENYLNEKLDQLLMEATAKANS